MRPRSVRARNAGRGPWAAWPKAGQQVVMTGPWGPDWRRIWPTAATNPDHDTYELWMRRHGHRALAATTH